MTLTLIDREIIDASSTELGHTAESVTVLSANSVMLSHHTFTGYGDNRVPIWQMRARVATFVTTGWTLGPVATLTPVGPYVRRAMALTSSGDVLMMTDRGEQRGYRLLSIDGGLITAGPTTPVTTGPLRFMGDSYDQPAWGAWKTSSLPGTDTFIFLRGAGLTYAEAVQVHHDGSIEVLDVISLPVGAGDSDYFGTVIPLSSTTAVAAIWYGPLLTEVSRVRLYHLILSGGTLSATYQDVPVPGDFDWLTDLYALDDGGVECAFWSPVTGTGRFRLDWNGSSFDITSELISEVPAEEQTTDGETGFYQFSPATVVMDTEQVQVVTAIYDDSSISKGLGFYGDLLIIERDLATGAVKNRTWEVWDQDPQDPAALDTEVVYLPGCSQLIIARTDAALSPRVATFSEYDGVDGPDPNTENWTFVCGSEHLSAYLHNMFNLTVGGFVQRTRFL